jgi:hypothetical protein
MGIDEAGKDGVRGEIGDRDAAGDGVGDRLNAISRDEDVGVLADRAGADVDQFASEYGLGECRCGGLLAKKNGGGGGEEGNKEEGGKEAAV